ncbi:hypothetical protein HJ184_09195 [Vibrio parahaemolyticus]|nr:hypothetical protein [Vibrio parahaemolyticus]
MAALMSPMPILVWAGRNVTEDLASYVKSLSFTDVFEDGEAGRDTMSLTLDNRDGLFWDAWKPEEGDTLKPGIGWTKDAIPQTWMWGNFVIDGVKFRISPNEVIVTASAQTENKAAVENVQSRSWDNITLHALLEQLAREAECEVTINALPDKTFTHFEQRAESTRALLQRLASEYNVPMSFKGGNLYVGTPSELPVLEIDTLDSSILSSADLPESKRNTYSAVTVNYYDVQKAQYSTYTTGDPSATSERTLMLYNIPVSSIEEAREYANAQLASSGDSKKQTANGSLGLVGTPISAGQTVKLLNIGKVHATWKIVSQTTSLRRGQWSATANIARA